MSKRIWSTGSLIAALGVVGLSGCTPLSSVGRTPELTSSVGTNEYLAMTLPVLPENSRQIVQGTEASLWSGRRDSLLGDRRARITGDILTVVIEIDDQAEFFNTTERERDGAEELSVNNLVGIPQRVDDLLPGDATLGSAIDLQSSSESSGEGSISRQEKLTLRVAATIIGKMPNGVFQIEGSQEVRVNYEVRELSISGFVRPEDVSRKNEITYDKIASARISYGGRGQISNLQQPRYGQQIADIILPF